MKYKRELINLLYIADYFRKTPVTYTLIGDHRAKVIEIPPPEIYGRLLEPHDMIKDIPELAIALEVFVLEARLKQLKGSYVVPLEYEDV